MPRLIGLATCLSLLNGSALMAQDLMLFELGSFGRTVLPQRESLLSDVMLETTVGAYNNEFVSNYGPKSIFARTGRAVGRLDILTNIGHAPCTAFLVEGNLLVTNHHCVPGILDNPRMKERGAESIVAVQFKAGYLRDGIEEGVQSFMVDPKPLESNKALDYSVLRVIGDANAAFGALELSAAVPLDRDPLWVIGHPMGEAQRISREKCQADSPAVSGQRLRHTCDTLPGNSGSPVIDTDRKQVVALHHAGSRAGQVNYAVPMSEILAASEVLKATAPMIDNDNERREAEASRALEAALALGELGARIEGLQKIAKDFAKSRAAVTAERILPTLKASQKNAQIGAEAEQALNAAMSLVDVSTRISALEQVGVDFPNSRQARMAALVLPTLKASQKDDQIGAKAEQALNAAMSLVDVSARVSALEQVGVDFPSSRQAGTAALILPTLKASQENERLAARADQALADAMQRTDVTTQIAALEKVAADFPNAAATAKLAINALKDKPKDIEPELALANARDRCLLQTASPFDPARPAGIPAVAFEDIDTEAALAFCRAPEAQARGSASVSFSLARALEAAGEMGEAHRYYTVAQLLGHVAATTALGRFERDGKTGKTDMNAAIRLFETAADQGDPVAMTLLAAIYEMDGGAVLRDYKSAEAHLLRAADLDHPHAHYALAKAHHKGTLYQKDVLKALDYYRRAAEAGDVRAQYEEAMIYWRGEKGVLKANQKRGLDLLLVAAEQGSQLARHRIGNSYLYGIKDPVSGVEIPADFVAAKRWLAEAADNGFVQAQMQLGKIFSQGSSGVDKDMTEALYWYEMAAKQDFVQALALVARMYEEGTGTEKDPVKAAAYWFRSMELRANLARSRPDDWDRDTARELQRLLRAAGVYNGALDGAIGRGSTDAMITLIKGSSRNITYFKPGIRIERTNFGWDCQC